MCLAIPGEIIEVEGDGEGGIFRTALVRFGGVERQINLAFLPDAIPGDFILAHAGIAISRIDESEASRVTGYLEEIGELEIPD